RDPGSANDRKTADRKFTGAAPRQSRPDPRRHRRGSRNGLRRQIGRATLTPGLLFAVMADKVMRGAAFYKTVLLLPYAVAPAIAGVLWLFLFNPSVGIIAVALRRAGIDWNYVLNGRQARHHLRSRRWRVGRRRRALGM